MNYLAILLATSSLIAPAFDDDAPQKPRIEILKPGKGDKLTAGATYQSVIRLELPEGMDEPASIDVDFFKGKATAGQFTLEKPKPSSRAAGKLEYKVEIKAPPGPGKYALKASLHGPRQKADDPSIETEVVVE